MHFEFSGKPPALLGSNTSFASFASSTANTPNKPATSAFGSPASFNSLTSSSHTTPPAGIPEAKATKTDGLLADDPLSKALDRAARNAPALFGAVDVGSDALLKEYAKQTKRSGGTSELSVLSRELSRELASLGEKHPLSKDFLQFVLEKAALSAKLPTTMKSLPAPTNSFSDASSDTVDERILQRQLVPIAHAKLAGLGWADMTPHREGYILDAKTKVACQLAFELRSKSALAEELFAEGLGKGAEDPRLLGFVKWIMEEVAEAREAVASETESFESETEAQDGDAPDGGALDAVEQDGSAQEREDTDSGNRKETLGDRAHFDEDARMQITNSNPFFFMSHTERRDALLKGAYVAPGYFGDKYNQPTENQKCCEKAPEPDRLPTYQETTGTEMPFRIMDLPPELRTWIYRHALVPGEVVFNTCKHSKPAGISPQLTLGLLTVCRQMHGETKGLVFENSFINDGACRPSTMSMQFSEKQMPHHILPQLRSLTLIIGPWTEDRRQLQAMTGLKSLRICGYSPVAAQMKQWRPVLTEIFESVPRECEAVFGAQTEVEKERCERKLERLKTPGVVEVGYWLDSAEALEAMAKSVKEEVEKGCKSGKSGLFYFDREGKLVHI